MTTTFPTLDSLISEAQSRSAAEAVLSAADTLHARLLPDLTAASLAALSAQLPTPLTGDQLDDIISRAFTRAEAEAW